MTRILVVDDEPMVARSIALQLRVMGIEAVAVHGGEEALAALVTGSFDLVISDVDMYPMTGLGLLAAMEAQALRVPLVFLSGLPRTEVVAVAQTSALVRGVLQKPLVGPAFFAAIRAALAPPS